MEGPGLPKCQKLPRFYPYGLSSPPLKDFFVTCCLFYSTSNWVSIFATFHKEASHQLFGSLFTSLCHFHHFFSPSFFWTNSSLSQIFASADSQALQRFSPYDLKTFLNKSEFLLKGISCSNCYKNNTFSTF